MKACHNPGASPIMTISLTPKLDRLLQEKLASGRYGTVEDVLTAALRALNHEEDTIAAIEEGHQDSLAGRYQTLEEADAEFRKYGIPAGQPHRGGSQ
jgi:putative addiction module CopG family antidote